MKKLSMKIEMGIHYEEDPNVFGVDAIYTLAYTCFVNKW